MSDWASIAETVQEREYGERFQRRLAVSAGLQRIAAQMRMADQFSAPVRWAKEYMRTERGGRLDFDLYPYMVQPLADRSQYKGLMSASQVGKTTIAISDVFHFADTCEVRIIYTMHTDKAVQDFSATRARPAIEASDYLRERVGGINNVHTKLFRGDGHKGVSVVFFRGAQEDTQALSEPADMVVHDELDFSSPNTLRLYQDRTAHSNWDRHLVVGTPTVPKFGIAAIWEESTQTEWLVKCPICGDERPLTYPDSFALDVPVPFYICARGHELRREHIAQGRWVDTWPPEMRRWRMYHIPRMLLPNWPADRVAEAMSAGQFPELDTNQVLGLPAAAGDVELDAETVTKLILDYAPARSSTAPTFAGCDQSSREAGHRVMIGRTDPDGMNIYLHLEVCGWQRLEELMSLYNIQLLVIDAQPETNNARLLAQKFAGRVYLAWYPNMPPRERTNLRIDRNNRRVDCDRTATLDYAARRLRNQQDVFPSMPYALRAQFLAEVTNMVRGLEMQEDNQPKALWRSVGPDHWRHAHNYATVASQMLSRRAGHTFTAIDLRPDLRLQATEQVHVPVIRPGYIPVPEGVVGGRNAWEPVYWDKQ